MKTPAYDEREQTEVKHEILRRYLGAFVPIVGDWAKDIAYIDCLAGPWRAVESDCRDTSFATAVRVLRDARDVLKKRGRAPHLRCLFIENNPQAYKKLKSYADSVSDLDAVAKDWDFTRSPSRIVEYVSDKPGSFPFFFIDPTGWEQIALPLIAPILKVSPGEVLITLMTSFIRRFVNVSGKGFDQILGPQAVLRLKGLRGEELEEELVNQYCANARAVGAFKYVCTLPVLKAKHDDFQFYMVYLTRHIRGLEVFKDTEKAVIPFMHETRAEAQSRRKEEQTGQMTFLDPVATYREHRYSRFRSRQLFAAKDGFADLLRRNKALAYREAREFAMQYAGVLEVDLREWIADLRERNLINVSNWSSRQRVLRDDNILQWAQ